MLLPATSLDSLGVRFSESQDFFSRLRSSDVTSTATLGIVFFL